MSNISNDNDLQRILAALNDQLLVREENAELVVIGGSGLIALGEIDRATRDVDLVALGSPGALLRAEPIPSGLGEAISQVARDFGLPEDWLNSEPGGLMDFGLPEGFEERLVKEVVGDNLTVYFASRIDQIHFKLYAMVDQGPGKHEQDLRAMAPTEDELIDAALWSTTQDPSEGFQMVLIQALQAMEVPDAADRI